jgi:catechol 2,3-dioxygenase-like lactoylglutathione lyase family enzyme
MRWSAATICGADEMRHPRRLVCRKDVGVVVKSQIGHLLFGVKPEHLGFYKDLLGFMGWKMVYDDPTMFGATASGGGGSLWFGTEVKPVANDYDGPGMNHLGIDVETQADVDTVATYLRERGVQHLFETPRHRPEFADGEANTYYQVMRVFPNHLSSAACWQMRGLSAARSPVVPVPSDLNRLQRCQESGQESGAWCSVLPCKSIELRSAVAVLDNGPSLQREQRERSA